ncbi:MAG: hypothetical protein EOM20_16485 [Spartobacteria bacterium]|nr:hypothetical protein [Spartobacteria bacterium]
MKMRMACVLVFVSLLLQSAWAEEASIGQVVGIQGEVTAVGPDGATRPLQLKSNIYRNDRITTGPEARLQIMFNDDTLFAQGENSEMVIDDYVFTPDRAADNGFGASLFKGIFRVITGKITELNPDRFKVKTGRAKIGIRGCELGFDTGVDRDVVYVLRLPSGKTIRVEPSDGSGRAQGFFSGRGAVELLQPGVVTVRDAGRLQQRGLRPEDLQVISGSTTPAQPVRSRGGRQMPESGDTDDDHYAADGAPSAERVVATDYQTPAGMVMDTPVDPGNTILQESEPYALTPVQPVGPDRPARPGGGGERPDVRPDPEPGPGPGPSPEPTPAGSWSYEGYAMACAHQEQAENQTVLNPPRIYTSKEVGDVKVHLDKDRGRADVQIKLTDVEDRAYVLGTPTETRYGGGNRFVAVYDTPEKDVVLVNREGGTDWTWGEWNGEQAMDPAKDDPEEQEREHVKGDYVVGRVLTGGEVDRIAQMSSVHTLTGVGEATAVFSDMYNAPLARLNGTADMNIRIGGGHQEWGGRYDLQGGGYAMNMVVRDGTPIVNGRLKGVPSSYNLSMNGTQVYGPGQVADAGMDGRLVGSPTRITGAIGSGHIRHKDYTRVDLLYGTDLK